MLFDAGFSHSRTLTKTSEAEHASEPMAGLIVALRERARRVLLGELDRSLRRRLRHLKPEEREALRAMIEAAIERLMAGAATRLETGAQRPSALAEAALVRALFGLGSPGRREAA